MKDTCSNEALATTPARRLEIFAFMAVHEL